MVRVQPAGAWKHPDSGTFEKVRLAADGGLRPAERFPVSAEPEERDRAWPVAAHLDGEPRSSGPQLRRRELGGAGARAGDKVGQAATQGEQQVLLRRMEKPSRDAGCGERWPEAVSGAREVIAGRRGIEARIDTAEKHLQPRSDHVLERSARGRGEIGLTGPRGRCSPRIFRRGRA